MSRQKATQYRERADELRQIAETMKDIHARDMVSRCADDYDRMANWADHRQHNSHVVFDDTSPLGVHRHGE
jgi:hypothetical protein